MGPAQEGNAEYEYQTVGHTRIQHKKSARGEVVKEEHKEGKQDKNTMKEHKTGTEDSYTEKE